MDIRYPELHEWCLLGRNNAIAAIVEDALNKALSDTVTEMRSGQHKTVGHAVIAVYARLHEIDRRFPNIGLFDSEPRGALADFFEQVAPGTSMAFWETDTECEEVLKLGA